MSSAILETLLMLSRPSRAALTLRRARRHLSGSNLVVRTLFWLDATKYSDRPTSGSNMQILRREISSTKSQPKEIPQKVSSKGVLDETSLDAPVFVDVEPNGQLEFETVRKVSPESMLQNFHIQKRARLE